VLAAFALIFGVLSCVKAWQKSAVWDEPIHLTAGYAALARGDFRIDPEHPPLLRQWAALPLLAQDGIRLDTAEVDQATPAKWAWTLYPLCQKFLYRDNDADSLLLRGRMMIAALGVALGVLVFFWVQEWAGFRPAVAALALYTLEPNIAAHSALVTTDAGAACFIFGAVYFLWRTCRSATWLNVAALSAFVALAVVSKYSALLLAPLLVALLAIAVIRGRGPTAAVAAALVVLLALVSWTAIWAAYGFRYLPGDRADWRYDFRDDRAVRETVPRLASVVGWIDDRRLLPNAFSQGLLFGQAKTHSRRGYFAGRYSDAGWWYYFPAAIALKTPVALLALIAVGAVALARRGPPGAPAAPVLFILLPVVLYLGVAMTTRINIGLRHVLPVYPFLILIAAAGMARLLQGTRWARRGLAAALVVALLEFGSIYPHTLAFFNQLAGGPSRGAALLVDSNLDWGQDLKPLKRWLDEHGVQHVNLAYFGTADPRYYRIAATHLPGSQYFVASAAEPPRLPGYVAISATVLSGVYLSSQQRAFYESFRRRAPVAVIGHSINVYWVERPWW
jgi:hypothetical protein